MSFATTVTAGLRALAGQARPDEPGYRVFNVALKRRITLSPCLSRLVFGGPDVARMRTLAPDQRIKVLFPGPDGLAPTVPDLPDWYATYRTLDPATRPPMRTYTLRQLRVEAEEVDVEFVLHGETGPASAWATHARVGDRVQLVAPNRAHAGDPGGYEWKPPQVLSDVVLIADETAVPAAVGILEDLASRRDPPRVQAFFEMPAAEDRFPLTAGPWASVEWLSRDEGRVAHGARMIEAARERARWPTEGAAKARPPKDIDLDRTLLWETASRADRGTYTWVAGESAAVMAIRRHLVGERGLDKRSCSFMGYWRHGKRND
ncbi:siderophore-interacting protein [Pseudomonas mangiferae]|uniref:Siderophore-interacting protein n=1 Tax=Pseudomonas mangiferae TaxID=2593654 RepID=A0A553GWU6_9PSED|nr:siderophore-interacting protein [Pseudomonas mangiferae]TRX73964.1 siderophore-interacting protein [Pseudomonas mangiferae]